MEELFYCLVVKKNWEKYLFRVFRGKVVGDGFWMLVKVIVWKEELNIRFLRWFMVINRKKSNGLEVWGIGIRLECNVLSGFGKEGKN